MANNRMYLRCDVCGGERFLGKRMRSGYYMAPAAEVLDAFYDEHDGCIFADETHGWDNFSLFYEHGREGGSRNGDDELPLAKATDAD